MATTVLTAADLESMEREAAGDLDRLREAAEQVISSLKHGVSMGGEPRWTLLVRLAEWLERTGQPDRARKALANVDREEALGVDPLALLCTHLLDKGFEDRAVQHAHTLRRAQVAGAPTYLHVGWGWERHENPGLAARWYTLGLGQSQSELERETFLRLRHRARRAAGLPTDVMDEEVEELLRQERAEPGPGNDPEVTPRRAPCPCGSGKRHKNCHGRDQPAAGHVASYHRLASRYAGNADGYDYYLDLVRDVP